MTSLGFRVAAIGVAVVLVLALLWHILIGQLQQSRDTPAPSAPPIQTSIILPDETAALPQTAVGETITAHCTACHSPDFITRQPPLDAKKWAATVTKMREAYHASIAPADDKAIVAALLELQASRPN